jgi:KaiC/GvpD/RAD55 family RecA-like ATPase
VKTMTVRGIDPSLAEKLKEAAKREGKSVNRYVVDSMKILLGEEKEKRFSVQYDDMDDLFGRWSQEEFERIQGKIDSERKIDGDLWT